MSLGICSSVQQRSMKRIEPPLRSGFVGPAPATLEKRSPLKHMNDIAVCLIANITAITAHDAAEYRCKTLTGRTMCCSLTICP